jgi:hypothetical protein
MAKGGQLAGTVITIIVFLFAIGGIYYFMSGKSQGTTGNGYTQVVPGSNSNQNTNQYPNQYGGRRKKSGNKKSPIMSTTGVYLLLGAVLVGYIVSHFR